MTEYEPDYKYEGNFVRGQKHGEGKETLEDGEVYQGEFRYGKRHGQGQLWETDGDHYEGKFANDK